MQIKDYEKEAIAEEKIFNDLMEKATKETNLSKRFKYYNRARLHIKISEALRELITLEGKN